MLASTSDNPDILTFLSLPPSEMMTNAAEAVNKIINMRPEEALGSVLAAPGSCKKDKESSSSSNKRKESVSKKSDALSIENSLRISNADNVTTGANGVTSRHSNSAKDDEEATRSALELASLLQRLGSDKKV